MTPESDPRAARALLAFWRAAGVDMEEAEAIYAGAPATGAPGAAPSVSGKLDKTPLNRPVPKPKSKSPADASLDAARALAGGAETIPALRAAVENFTGCALKQTARTTVFADGVEGAPILVIGEAPGKEEDEQGRPFVGPAGRMLDQMLDAIGLSRKSNVLISNTIFWRPPGNRDPTAGEIVSCLPFAERLVELTQPKLLILAGKAAANTMLRREDGVGRLRGRKLLYTREGIKAPINAMVMLHPAYLLRRPNEKRLAWGDLLLAEAWLDELGVARVAHS